MVWNLRREFKIVELSVKLRSRSRVLVVLNRDTHKPIGHVLRGDTIGIFKVGRQILKRKNILGCYDHR